MYAYYGSFLCVSTRTRRQWPIMIQTIFPSNTPHNNTHTPLPASSLHFRYAHISVSCTLHLSVPLVQTWLSLFSPPLLPRIRTTYLFAIHHHDDDNAPSLGSIPTTSPSMGLHGHGNIPPRLFASCNLFLIFVACLAHPSLQFLTPRAMLPSEDIPSAHPPTPPNQSHDSLRGHAICYSSAS